MKNLKLSLFIVLILFIIAGNAQATSKETKNKVGQAVFYAIWLDNWDSDCGGRPASNLDHQQLANKLTKKYFGMTIGETVKSIDRNNNQNTRRMIYKSYTQERDKYGCDSVKFKQIKDQKSKKFYNLYLSLK